MFNQKIIEYWTALGDMSSDKSQAEDGERFHIRDVCAF